MIFTVSSLYVYLDPKPKFMYDFLYVFFSLNWSKEVSVVHCCFYIKIVVLYENPVYTENETKNWPVFLIANPNQEPRHGVPLTM